MADTVAAGHDDGPNGRLAGCLLNVYWSGFCYSSKSQNVSPDSHSLGNRASSGCVSSPWALLRPGSRPVLATCQSMTAEDRQRDYYEQTAAQYAELHVQPGDEHFVALEYVVALLAVARATSVLDVGSGTGRGARFLRQRRPDLRVMGLEPSDALREEAAQQGGEYVAGGGQDLPFPDKAFDAVIACGVMHHVPDPAPVVDEMVRVARRAVMISDSNRFGQGTRPMRLVKPVLHRAGLWPRFEKLRTRGRGYMESETDGVFYSYSVYDSVAQVAAWGDRIFVIPTTAKPAPWTGGFFTASHGLLVAIREPEGPGWAGQ